MLKATIALGLMLILTGLARSEEISIEKMKACETQLKDKNKEDKAAAPAGFKPDHPRGYRIAYIVECLKK